MAATVRWKLDRERGRLALRKSDVAAAAAALERAVDDAGADAETFLLAADTVLAGGAPGLGDKARARAAERLAGRAEEKIVQAKLLLAADKLGEAEQLFRAAKEALKTENASPRRLAQADLGLAVIAYYRQKPVDALNTFELVLKEDPSIVDAYLFVAELEKDKKKALEQVKLAVSYNPDYVVAWELLGRLAIRMGDRKAQADVVARLTQLAPTSEVLRDLKRR
jgi:tetratricopeptide (TPR) repeat protein